MGIAFFFDEDGIVDDYFVHLLASLRPFCKKILLVSNGPLLEESEAKVAAVVDELIVRDNKGFDVGAYKEALMAVGWDALGAFDEVLLFNHTFYGPLFPFTELFNEMDGRDCDFWGITAHKKVVPNPLTGKGVLDFHVQSHFIAVRKSLVASKSFRDYWMARPKIKSYLNSILKHEIIFTKHFMDLGYSCEVYLDSEELDSIHPILDDIDEAVAKRCPIMKRRSFFADPRQAEAKSRDLPRALRLIAQTSDYDPALIWRNIVRTSEPRVLNTNAALMTILPDIRTGSKSGSYGRIAVVAHIYYVDMTDEVLDWVSNIPVEFDLFVTTDTEAKKLAIEAILSARNWKGLAAIRIVESNLGRDVSAMLIACRDVVLDGTYDFICRVHSKKVPQLQRSRGRHFTLHLIENLLHSPGYVANLLDMLMERPWVGMAIAPIVHIGYPTLGKSWFGNRETVERVAEMLDLRVKLDVITPVAAYGSMYWFRPVALQKLFRHPWKWSDFEEDEKIGYGDGDLAHGLERILAYVAQDARYTVQHVMCAHSAEQNYTMLEWKASEVSMLERALKRMRNSISWRLTRPFRLVKDLVKWILGIQSE
ncbi:rhamnan synthesis F family protein [Bradyrhizobium sp.]|uniref:rhamnan synthesis F family protein n=1 Tax=Bradyrhizobium sp. TaxID=376 RepID=UPI0025C2DAAD|nr:rhamnan synthesis F family protein [Bradyrhizobium sp.]